MIPHELIVQIASYITQSSKLCVLDLSNLEYYSLFLIKYPELYPIKFVYGQSIKDYDWKSLYISIIKDYPFDFLRYNHHPPMKRILKKIRINIFLFLWDTGKINYDNLTEYLNKLYCYDISQRKYSMSLNSIYTIIFILKSSIYKD